VFVLFRLKIRIGSTGIIYSFKGYKSGRIDCYASEITFSGAMSLNTVLFFEWEMAFGGMRSVFLDTQVQRGICFITEK